MWPKGLCQCPHLLACSAVSLPTMSLCDPSQLPVHVYLLYCYKITGTGFHIHDCFPMPSSLLDGIKALMLQTYINILHSMHPSSCPIVFAIAVVILCSSPLSEAHHEVLKHDFFIG